MNSGHYSDEEEFSICDYFDYFSEGGIPSFRGYVPFKELKDMGAIVFGYTEIRLHFSGKEDEHYKIKDEIMCKGITDLIRHSGKKGTFNIEELLEETEAECWEIDGLNKSALRKQVSF